MGERILLQQELAHARVQKRTEALKKIAQMKFGERHEALDLALPLLRDMSITVQRQAVKTLASFHLTDVPNELKVLAQTTTDRKLKAQCIAVVRRIELMRKKKETGEIEWNVRDYVFSVTDFVIYVNTLLSDEIVYIKGEVTEIRVFRETLVFFSLRDETGVLHCWFVRSQQYAWNVELAEGIEVVVQVKPQVSPKSGKFGLRVFKMSLSGEGSLKHSLEKLRKKLEAEGLFDESRKRSLPFLPDRIGLITGEQSAAYSDFIKVLNARMGGVKIYFIPVRVQGVGSIAEVCGAIDYFNNHKMDLVVLTRGGGGLEDLQSFNSEEVARAVFSSKNPIVVAVGHEKDRSLAEYAADMRASTPSNAAEIIVPDRRDLDGRLRYVVQIIERQFTQEIHLRKRDVFAAIEAVHAAVRSRIQYYQSRINSLPILFGGLVQRMEVHKQQLRGLQSRVLLQFEKYITLKRSNFNAQYKLLHSFSPKNILKRGYSVVKSRGTIVKSAIQVNPGEHVEVYPYEGKILSKVIESNV